MRTALHRRLLLAYRRLPPRARRWLVRLGTPSFTVGATCVIERPDGAVLLVRHVYRPGWGVPGGLLRRGEEPADGVRREVREEVGIDVELVGEPALVVDASMQRVDVVYRARPRSLAALGELRVAASEIDEARWFAPDALPELQTETAAAFVALARSARSPQAHPLPPP